MKDEPCGTAGNTAGSTPRRGAPGGSWLLLSVRWQEDVSPWSSSSSTGGRVYCIYVYIHVYLFFAINCRNAVSVTDEEESFLPLLSVRCE